MTGPAAGAPMSEAPPSPAPDAAATERPRSRVVLYSALGVGIVLAVFVAVLASVKPGGNKASTPLLGKAAPPVAGRSLSGSGHHSLAQLAGKWVLLNFSASWCIPCRQETPQLVRFEKQHAATGNAEILAVEFDPSDTSNLAAFLASSHASWPAIQDPSAEVAYGVSGIPESYLIDPQGTVVAKYFGGVTAAQVDKTISTGS